LPSLEQVGVFTPCRGIPVDRETFQPVQANEFIGGPAECHAVSRLHERVAEVLVDLPDPIGAQIGEGREPLSLLPQRIFEIAARGSLRGRPPTGG
jgi:hypothetical protein